MTKNDEARFASLALTGFALLLEPTTGVASLIARIANLVGDKITDDQIEKLGERVDSVESRVAAIEQSRIPARKLSGNPLRLLAYSIRRESRQLFGSTDAGEARTALNLSPQEYREAAKELEFLNLVTISPSANDPGGIVRTMLQPRAFLSAAPALLLDVNLPSELRLLFDILRSVPPEQYRVSVPDVLKQSLIPLPRFDLMLRALEDIGFLKGHGPAADEWGSYFDIEITPAGRRILRGDDPLLV